MTSLKIKTLAVTGFMLAVLAGPVHAETYLGVVRDSEGLVVRNTTGNCVRTHWVTDHDECHDRLEIALAERTVYFEFAKSSLTKEGRAKLMALAAKLKAQNADIESIDIVGYADRIGTPSYNEKLSQKRAEAVRAFLAAHGVMNKSATKVRWLGERDPTTDCPEKMKRKQLIKCLAPDRRVEVEVIYKP